MAEAASAGLLRTMLVESILSLFNQVQQRAYSPVPEGLIDLMLRDYDGDELFCYPTAWDEARQGDVSAGAQVDKQGVHVLLEVKKSSSQKTPPVVGAEGHSERGLMISYSACDETWFYEQWR